MLLEYTSNIFNNPSCFTKCGAIISVIIKARNIKRSFDGLEAVKGIDIEVESGEVFGFLGPNGAGKTTGIRMLTTMLRPTSGSIEINGFDIGRNSVEAKASIGVSQQNISLNKDITVRQNIKYRALLHRMPYKEIEGRIKELSDLMGLGPYLDMEVSKLSGGWKRKTSLVCAIVHRPKILFLDEPTAGLDTKSRHMLWDLIRKLNRAGTTIFLTTHYIEEAEDLCDRVAIMNQGAVVDMGSPEELCDSIGRVTVEYYDGGGNKIMRQFRDGQSGKEFMETLESDTMMSIRKTTLEDVFLIVTGEEYTKGCV